MGMPFPYRSKSFVTGDGKQRSKGLLPSKVCRHFAPACSLPFADGNVAVIVRAQPGFGAGYEVEELFCESGALQGGAAGLFLQPQQGVAAVGVDSQYFALLLE